MKTSITSCKSRHSAASATSGMMLSIGGRTQPYPWLASTGANRKSCTRRTRQRRPLITLRSVAVDASLRKSAIRQSEVHMTDVLVPVFIPYARFLEVRARRLGIAIQATPPDGQCTNVAVSSAPLDQSLAPAVMRVLETSGRGGVQRWMNMRRSLHVKAGDRILSGK